MIFQVLINRYLNGGILQGLEQESGETQRRFDQDLQTIHYAADILKHIKYVIIRDFFNCLKKVLTFTK